MATLAADTPRDYEQGNIGELPVVATDIIYLGAAVGSTSGNARPLVAGDPFHGFSEQKADNSTGAAGDKRVRFKKSGVIKLPVTGVTGIGDVGKDVYASDDNTFTLTQGSNTRIGHIERFVSGTNVMVAFRGVEGVEAELSMSVGTADGTVADVGASFNQTTLNNNFRDIGEKVNYLLRKMGG